MGYGIFKKAKPGEKLLKSQKLDKATSSKSSRKSIHSPTPDCTATESSNLSIPPAPNPLSTSNSPAAPLPLVVQIFSTPPHCNLFPLPNSLLSIPPNPALVNQYSVIETKYLVSQALDQNDAMPLHGPLELYIEIHRRATNRYLQHGTRYQWDRGAAEKEGKGEMVKGERQNRNARWIKEYDMRWGIVRKSPGRGWMLEVLNEDGISTPSW